MTLTAALVLGGVAVIGSTSEGPQDPERDGVRIVLANVHFGFDVDGRSRAIEVGELLAGLDADVVVLNEVDRGWLISGAPDLLGRYERASGMTGVFGAAADPVWGNAVLTRLPVLEVQQARLPRGRDPLTRSVLTVVVELPDGRPVAIVATHLSDVDQQGDTRLPQAQSVAAVVARLVERGLDVIVAGDLNARPGDPALEVLESLLVRTLSESSRTFPAAAPRVQIDHILAPASWRVVEARAFNSGFSDHRFVDVLLEPPPLIDASGRLSAPAGR
jgi:endonuclease/exonuclease/phosphatase family metal-dependent hydrolase